MIRERYAAEHADEIAEYNKAVRYLKANQMIPDDRQKYEARRTIILKEIAQAEERLRAADLDPEIIRTLRYQIEKVTEAGGFRRKRKACSESSNGIKRNSENRPSRRRKGRSP